jgi:hypothetical protein
MAGHSMGDSMADSMAAIMADLPDKNRNLSN